MAFTDDSFGLTCAGIGCCSSSVSPNDLTRVLIRV